MGLETRVAFQRFTADGAVVSINTPVVIYGGTVRSTGGGTAEAHLRNGGLVTGDIIMTLRTPGSTQTDIKMFDMGITFPTGCFIDVDANTEYVSIFYQKLT
jgi:predicted aconitase with swiveling domain